MREDSMAGKLIVANWKMNGDCKKIIHDISLYASNSYTNIDNVVLALPNIYLAEVSQLLTKLNISLAAQDVSQFEGFGAFTGEVSAKMLSDLDVKYVIVGHSERRSLLNETGDTLLPKLDSLLSVNITPIFCVGETKDIRESGRYLDFLSSQLELLLQLKNKITNLVIAYEPVWSIGTGLIPSDHQIVEVSNLIHAFMQSYLPYVKIRILYGGSVSSKNAASILNLPLIDGVLVGGASLKVDEFTAICSHG